MQAHICNISLTVTKLLNDWMNRNIYTYVEKLRLFVWEVASRRGVNKSYLWTWIQKKKIAQLVMIRMNLALLFSLETFFLDWQHKDNCSHFVIRALLRTIQGDNDLNYCVCLSLLLQCCLLLCSLEVINSLLWLAAECPPTVWLNSSLQSRPERGTIAPQDTSPNLLMIFTEDTHTHTHTYTDSHTHYKYSHRAFSSPSKQRGYENLITTEQVCFICSSISFLLTRHSKINKVLGCKSCLCRFILCQQHWWFFH